MSPWRGGALPEPALKCPACAETHGGAYRGAMGVVASASIWPDDVAAVAAPVSSIGVVAGGGFAYFKFLRDAPYMPRANLGIEAELLTRNGYDMVRVSCTVSAVGRGALKFIKDDEELPPPSVDVFPITQEVAENYPQEWSDVYAACEVFVNDDSAEAGEVLQDVVLVWIGQRVPGVLAYRVVGSFSAPVGIRGGNEPFTWQAVAIVPVEASLVGVPARNEAGVRETAHGEHA
jgi:hypothetical protein